MGEKKKRDYKGRARKPQEPCIKCEKRLTRRFSKMCVACEKMFPDEAPKWEIVPFRQRFQSYLKLREQGLTQREIAAKWGIGLHGVKDIPRRARELDIAVSGVQSNRVTEHGGGKSGIRGCKCELCVLKRREYMNDRGAVARAKRRAAKKAAAEEK